MKSNYPAQSFDDLFEGGSGNTRHNCQPTRYVETSIGWFQGTFKFFTDRQLAALKQYVHASTEDMWVDVRDKPITRGKRYLHQTESFHGTLIAWTDPEGDFPGEALVSIPATALERVDLEAQLNLVVTLKNGYKVKPTRIDGTIDLYGYWNDRILEKAYAAGKAGNFTGSREFDPRIPLHRVGDVCFPKGKTFYFGSANSRKRLRLYDKNLESKGEKNCIRWEVQFSGYNAVELVDQLAEINTYEERMKHLQSVTIGAVIFVKYDSGDRFSRRKQLSWYEKLQEDIAYAKKISVARVKSSIQKTINWIVRQVAPSLALVRGCFGFDKFYSWLDRLLDKSLIRLSPINKLRIQQEGACDGT